MLFYNDHLTYYYSNCVYVSFITCTNMYIFLPYDLKTHSYCL